MRVQRTLKIKYEQRKNATQINQSSVQRFSFFRLPGRSHILLRLPYGPLPKGEEFVLRELIATPPALIGRWFYENVNKGLVKNVEHIGKAEGGVEKYKRI